METMVAPERACFHCGEPVPPDADFSLELEGTPRVMCCAGCLAVAELIAASGYGRYYRFRQALARRAGDDVERLLAAWRSMDDRQELWGIEGPGGAYDLLLQTEGIRCAACAWLIRNELARVAGVEEVQVDVASGFTRILWRPQKIRLSEIAGRLLRLGYKPHLPLAAEEERARQDERSASLKRLGVAGLGMMQVMMYAVGLYAGEALGIEEAPQRFLEWVSLLVTTPVLVYSGRVFIDGAVTGLRAGRPGMDLPVALAITGAYVASCINFFSGRGEVWFDSVVMFIFFLSLARHVEMGLRHRNQRSGTALARLLPEWAERIGPGGTETVALDDLSPGDRVRVNPGDSFPADGVLCDSATRVNEALLTGESQALERHAGDRVIAGSINLSQPVTMEVVASGQQTAVSALGRLLHRARTLRCRSVDTAERFAGWFVIGVLAAAGLSLLWWAVHDPGRALGITLSVLVVSCPCAFSLASPAVIAATSRALLRRGIILANGNALETLAAIKRAVFDKTGTLTSGTPGLEEATLNHARNDFSADQALEIAAALEQHSAHPLARAFHREGRLPAVEAARSEQGRGVSGMIGGREFRIGTRAFVSGDERAQDPAGQGVWLGDGEGWLAVFRVSDRMRTGVAELIRHLHGEGMALTVLSGDHPAAVEPVARRLGIADWYARQTPEMKLERLREATRAEGPVLAVGDGVNDAPVLAAADVSIAVQGGAELANSAADFILTGESLLGAWEARQIAVRARRIIRQNLAWAASYNVTMIPLAIGGALKPWMAALGMSASSLLVVLNAARIVRGTDGPADVAADSNDDRNATGRARAALEESA